MSQADRAIDPITLSTVWHGFQSIGREMRHVIDRTAQSYLIAQLHDMAAGRRIEPTVCVPIAAGT